MVHSVLLLLTLAMQAMDSHDPSLRLSGPSSSVSYGGQAVPTTSVCSSGRHLRRYSWPRTASDQCTEVLFSIIHEECANKALQVRMRQAGLKVVENNQEIE